MAWARFCMFWLFASLPLLSRAIPVQSPLSARQDEGISFNTSLGPAAGVLDTAFVARLPVRYATSSRWRKSVIADVWEIPNNLTDPTATPRACPQPSSSENSADTDEDCLNMILYVPVSGTDMPTMVWVHGGSFIVGSASGPGLNGSALAEATGSIVAVIQYRLGAFGFLSPDGETNLAVNDVITALNFLQEILPGLNGDPNEITIAGQSSGALMVRALLAIPSASSLFQSAILQSDPMNFGFLSTNTFNTLNDYFVSQLGCSATDTACLSSLSTDEVLSASNSVFGAGASLDAAAGAFEPMRPVKDGSLITNALDLTESFPSQSKPIIVTTVRNEAGPSIYGTYTDAVAESQWDDFATDLLGSSRSSVVVNSSFYVVPAEYAASNSTIDARIQFEKLGTDFMFRCPSWSFARLWAGAGGRAYVGEYLVGATYPSNSGIEFCTSGGVCHEDDIEIVFGTASSPSTAQASLIASMQASYGDFFSGGTPASSWPAVSGDDANAIILGGADNGNSAVIDACDPGFWGSAVSYDYQLFNN
ncbi:hypothetical protein ACEPAF_4589 [Sanghuangporus sanghuang]